VLVVSGESADRVLGRNARLTSEKSLPALRAFVEQGGTLVAMGGEVEKVVRHFDLPVKTGVHVLDPDSEGGERRVRREQYYVPGSLLAIEVDTASPIARGCASELAAMVDGDSTVLEVTDPQAAIEVIARYRHMDTLVSGWAIGHVGEGRILLFGADVTYRGQPLGTARLLFQAILTTGEH
jgi:hypothetical protein